MKSIYGLPLLDLKVLPERMIKEAAKVSEDDPDNAFATLLESANVFRQEGLTPIFLCDSDMQRVMVTTKETLQKKFH